MFGNSNKGIKVFVGLSGGVDSAVSAALLQSQGYEVTGVFIRIALPGYPCSAGEDKIEAMRVAAHLKIPFLSIDLSKEYTEEVFAHTIEEFKKGRTPNPDTLCNQKIKFGAFYKFAKSHGANFIATGHYAKIKDGKLFAGRDETKDQSYFLWMVPEEVLRHTLFPVGNLEKSEVRALAKKFALPNAARKDSQGLCFLGDISIEDMLVREVSPTPGQVLNEHGEVVGVHRGVALYTLGQRHGFELFKNAPDMPVHFVIAKNSDTNTIVVSPSRFPQGVERTKVELTDTNWIGQLPSTPCQARFRYRAQLIPATLDATKHTVVLDEPHYIPEGQSLVLYSGGRCLGGGVVAASLLL